LVIARRLAANMAAIPGAVDVHLAQVPDTPELAVDVDRSAAQEIGFSMRDVATNILVSLSGSFQTAPNFWMDPSTGVQYTVAVQTPQFRVDSIPALQSTPLAIASNPKPQLLSNVANVSRTLGPTNITHYNVARTVDVQAGVDGTDLGAVSVGVQKLVDQARTQLPRGSTISLVGQSQAMNASFLGLGFGILFAVVLVYLLIAVNFQSWLDPLIILMALPGTIAGIVWALFLTGTTLSIPALMGALMSIGVASANSILVVTFALERRREGDDLIGAAVKAGSTRLRPVMMTAIAMILGMLPMALGFGDGGEQNAPLGRAVIGGLVFATVSTLFFVPVMFSVLAKHTQVGEAKVPENTSPPPHGGLAEQTGSAT
jgi:multidrug efflux pump subunit AcrB